MFGRLKGVAVGCASLAIASTVVYAAGNYSMYPIVGGASFCASTVSGAGGFNAAGNTNNVNPTGQGQATSGSLCAQTVPAGPSIVTGNELIPADTQIGSGGNPQTVVLTLASLNALPLTVATINTASQTVAAAATSGGVFLHLASGQGAAMTAVTIDFPSAPIDGQQFAISGDASVTTLTLTALNLPANVKISLSPTGMTAVNSALMGFRYVYSAALNQWGRLQ